MNPAMLLKHPSTAAAVHTVEIGGRELELLQNTLWLLLLHLQLQHQLLFDATTNAAVAAGSGHLQQQQAQTQS